jgi:poly-gamma-glutamate capsule biosynthesis protein CapA/YwtB (metallophosphatase superfamily)
MSAVIGLLGDIYLDRTHPGNPFDGVGVGSADFWFANLEAALTDAGDDVRQRRAWTSGAFKMRPAVSAHLKDLTAVSVANNHALDYGHDAYRASLAALDDAGVGHAGGGENAAAARSPLYCHGNGMTVAFLAYTCLYQDGWQASEDSPGMATVKVHTTYEAPLRVFEQPGWPPIVHTYVDFGDRNLLAAEIAAARTGADFVLVSFHWGLSTGTRAVVEYQEELGRIAVDSGADAVFGHHPHSLQPMLVHKRKPVFLSLGNIVFDYDKAWRGDNATAAVRLYVEERGVCRVGITPLVRDTLSNPVLADSAEASRRIVERILPAPLDEQLEQSWSGSECLVSLLA